VGAHRPARKRGIRVNPTTPSLDTRNEAAENLRHRLPPWDGMRELLDAALSEERRRTVERAKRHTPRLYEADPHGSQIHCSCGIAFHIAGWWAHLTVEVLELVR
jgi:hypothetical protein